MLSWEGERNALSGSLGNNSGNPPKVNVTFSSRVDCYRELAQSHRRLMDVWMCGWMDGWMNG